MAKKVKYLSEYEEDLIWMSYRYCIGRHTIAAGMHAGNIAKHAYNKLQPERQQFMAYDIRRSIEDVLCIGEPSFFIDSNIDRRDYRPLEMYLEALKENGIKNNSDLSCIKSIRVTNNSGKVEYTVTKLKEDEHCISEHLLSDIHDLFTWANLAACFDKQNHKMVTVKLSDTNETYTTECFESYQLKSYDSYEYEKCFVPVDKYICFPAVITKINPEYITKIENIQNNR